MADDVMTTTYCETCGALIGCSYSTGHRPGCPDAAPPLERALLRLDRIGSRLAHVERLLCKYARRVAR